MENEEYDALVNATEVNEIDENGISVTIDKDILIDKKTGNLLIEYVYDQLGNLDIVECNEIKPKLSTNDYDSWFIGECKVYVFTEDNIEELKESGATILKFKGFLIDNIDRNNDEHIEFLKWYYSTETIVETIKQLQDCHNDCNINNKNLDKSI